MVLFNIHLKLNSYSHYDCAQMKKVASGISPVIAIDKRKRQFLYKQVYEAYRQAIVEGRLAPGQRVPSTRIAAMELGISRIPVLDAYAQLLAEGYFESRVGSGTVVSRSLPGRAIPLRPSSLSSPSAGGGGRPVAKRCSALSSGGDLYRRRGRGAFAVGQVAFDHFPFQVWNRLVTRHSRRMRAGGLDYGDAMGLPDLREAIASHLRTARGFHCQAEQIVVVSGSQQGLELACRVLLDAGNRVWMEEPGYSFARTVFTSNDCSIVPVPVDSEGLDVASGIRQCRRARAAVVTPSHQYPLGATMSASRRLQLLDWAANNEAWIIEDDYDSEHRYEGLPATSLQGMDRNSRVVYVGTFSKVLFPALRLGYVVAPPDLVERFRAVRLAMDICPPTLFQNVLADFLREGHFSRHIRRMRALYAERRSVLIESLRQELGHAAELSGGQAGMHLAILMNGIDDRAATDRAERVHLWLTPLSPAYHRSENARTGFIVGFGSVPVQEIPDAVRKFQAVLNAK